MTITFLKQSITIPQPLLSRMRHLKTAFYILGIIVLMASSHSWSPIGIAMVVGYGLVAACFKQGMRYMVKAAVGIFGLIIFYTFLDEIIIVEYLTTCSFILLVFVVINVAVNQVAEKNTKSRLDRSENTR